MSCPGFGFVSHVSCLVCCDSCVLCLVCRLGVLRTVIVQLRLVSCVSCLVSYLVYYVSSVSCVLCPPPVVSFALCIVGLASRAFVLLCVLPWFPARCLVVPSLPCTPFLATGRE